MDNLGIDELKQLLNYYKQRSADLEFALLQLQIKISSSEKASAEKPDKKQK